MSEERPKKCKNCDKQITVHVTKVIAGKVLKVGLCASCPHAETLSNPGFDLIEDPSGVALRSLPSNAGPACPSCGLKPADFKDSGRLGCSRCYETFAEKLEPMLAKLHRGRSHTGKRPRRRERSVSAEELADLKRRLQELVSREEYELAATLRDEIKALEA